MKYKKIFSRFFIVVLFSISVFGVVLMFVFKGDLSENFPFKNTLLAFKTSILNVVGVNEFEGIYRAQDQLIKIAGPENQEITEKNTQVIIKTAQKTKTPVYFALVPTAEYIERSGLTRRPLVWNQGNYIDNVYYKVIEEANVIDIAETFANYSEENIYFKTSDSISSQGGYYIFQEVMRRLGYQVEDIQKYDIEYFSNNYKGELSKSFTGSGLSDVITFYRYPLFKRSLTMKVTDETGKITVYKDVYAKDKNDLDSYLGGENPVTVINNTEPHSERILVISDNTFNMSAGFFVDYFSEITVINPLTDPKGFEKLNMDNYNSVLIFFSTNTFNGESIEQILNMIE